VSINIDLPPAVAVSLNIDAWPHSYQGWTFNKSWEWYWGKIARNRTCKIGRLSSKFVWENIDSFSASRETFCNVYGPQFDTTELDVMSAFENIFDTALVQLTVEEANRYAHQEISKSIRPLTFCSIIRKWEDVTHFTTCLHCFVPSSCPLPSFLETLVSLGCLSWCFRLAVGWSHPPQTIWILLWASSILETRKPISLSMSFIFCFHFL
jgi:hypothetical protein